jgi:alkylation response protein AidB-like acyl-CoA dehydrogenase
MEFALSRSELDFRDEVRAFLAKEWGPPSLEESMLANTSHADPERAIAFRRRLGETGWLSAWWPPEYGGRGRKGMEAFIFAWELSAHGAPYPFFAVNVISRLLMRHGTEEQRQFFLPRISSGDIDFALGFTEPDAGSDLASLKLPAKRVGDTYVINGMKVFTSHVTHCEYVWLATRTDPEAPKHKGVTIFMVPTASPGFSTSPLHVISGGSTNMSYYDNVEVPVFNRFGEENRGWQYVRESMDLDRSVGIQYGYFPTVFTALREKVEEHRDALGERYDVYRARVAELAVDVRAVVLMCLHIGRMLADGEIPHVESSTVKVFGSELRERMAGAWLDLLADLRDEGVESPPSLVDAVERFYVGTRGKLITGGTNEIQRTIIARHLGLPNWTT